MHCVVVIGACDIVDPIALLFTMQHMVCRDVPSEGSQYGINRVNGVVLLGAKLFVRQQQEHRLFCDSDETPITSAGVAYSLK